MIQSCLENSSNKAFDVWENNSILNPIMMKLFEWTRYFTEKMIYIMENKWTKKPFQ